MILTYLQSLLTLDVLFALILGTVGGMIIGILPGLGATMAISLLIPVTYTMDPIAAIVLLATVYTTATYGGSITAVLLCTPGTASSAATALDGYELTKKGRGLEAIGMTTISSMFGGVVGGLALLLIAPPLSKLALQFSHPEYFWIAIFGITIIGSLAGDDPVKGYAAGVIGVFIGLIGMETSTAYARFTFGNIHLQSGISLVPCLLGLFTISQMLLQVEKMAKTGALNQGQVEVSDQELGKKFLPNFKEFLHYLPIMIRASLVGLLVGILPGAGGDIGSWIGYNTAKNMSKHKEEFGKGSMEGVCGSESANNAVCGGAYIPLLVLGIPGSGAAAILLGGLSIHGLQTGNSLFTTNARIIYPIILAYIAANILMGLVGMVSAKHLSKIAMIPMKIVIPIVLVLSLVGAYSINMQMFDVYVAIFFGFVGYLMRKCGFPTAPVVLGLILGPMAEAGLYTSMQMKKDMSILTYFAVRPICWVFFILTIGALFAPTLLKIFKKKSGIIETSDSGAAED